MRFGFVLLLTMLPCSLLCADRHDPPGTRYPAMKVAFSDPLTGRQVWRMTTDAKQETASNALGDLSSEVTSWSPDGSRITYIKRSHREKPDGVYVMDVLTGIETVVAIEASSQYAVFSRSSEEVFYTVRANGWPRREDRPRDKTTSQEPSVQVNAVSLQDYRIRILKKFPGAIWIGPPVQNCDGSHIALFPTTGDVTATSFNDMSEQCVIVNPGGEAHPRWDFHPDYFHPHNADFALWHPTDPKLLVTRRFLTPTEVATRVWHVDTLQNPYAGDRVVGHSTWHPNGELMLEHDLWDLEKAAIIKPLSIGGPHKNFNPTDGALGLAARVSFDGRKAPYALFVMTLDELKPIDPVERARLLAGQDRSPEANRQLWYVQEADPSKAHCLHYSDFSSNAVHPHAHWSPDGRHILWQSNVAFVERGAPPGGSGSAANTNATDLFIIPFDSP